MSTKFLSARYSLQDFAVSIGGDTLAPVAYHSLSHYTESYAWQEVYASLTALASIAQACAQVLPEKLDQILPLILMHSKHDQPWVRWASIDAIGKLSLVLGPSFASEHHSTLFHILANAVDDLDSHVQAHSLVVVAALSDLCSPEIMASYLEELVHKFLGLVDKAQTGLVLGSALRALSSVLDKLQDHFPNYDDVVEVLKSLKESENFTEELCLLSVVCMKSLGMLIGRERFQEDAHEIIEMFDIMRGRLSDEDPLIHAMDEAWLRYCLVLGEDYGEYMNDVVQYLLQFVQADQEGGLIIVSTDETEKMLNNSLIGIIHGEGAQFVKEDAMEKAMKACEMFHIYAEIFKGDFFPWIKEIALAVAPLFEGGQLLRRSAISATLQLLRSAEVAVERGVARREDMKDVSGVLHASLVGVMGREGEAKFAEILKEAMERALEFAES